MIAVIYPGIDNKPHRFVNAQLQIFNICNTLFRPALKLFFRAYIVVNKLNFYALTAFALQRVDHLVQNKPVGYNKKFDINIFFGSFYIL